MIATHDAPDWTVGSWNMTGDDIMGVNSTWVVGNGTASWCGANAENPTCCDQVQWNAWASIAVPVLVWPVVMGQLSFKSSDADSTLWLDFKEGVKDYFSLLTLDDDNKVMNKVCFCVAAVIVLICAVLTILSFYYASVVVQR